MDKTSEVIFLKPNLFILLFFCIDQYCFVIFESEQV